MSNNVVGFLAGKWCVRCPFTLIMSKTREATNMLSSFRDWLPSMSSRLPRLQYSVSTHTAPGSTHAPINGLRLSWRTSRICVDHHHIRITRATTIVAVVIVIMYTVSQKEVSQNGFCLVVYRTWPIVVSCGTWCLWINLPRSNVIVFYLTWIVSLLLRMKLKSRVLIVESPTAF